MNFSKDLHGEPLLEAWEQAKSEGITMREMAKAMGISRKTLDTRLIRARRRRAGRSGKTNKPLKQGVTSTGSANALEIESNTSRITTLEQLLEACQVDLDVWRVDRWVANKWDVGAKDKSGRVVTEPLFQVKAWLVRKEPEPIRPAVRPVQITVSFPDPKPSECKRLKQALIIPDIQVGFRKDLMTGQLTPFHDRIALDVVVQIAQAGEFDDVVYLGDMLDLTEWTDRFLRSPEFYFVTQPAILELAWWMGRIRQATPNARTVALEGNHEARLETSLVTHLAAAYQLRAANEMELPPALSVPKLLGLDSLGIEWVRGYPEASLWLTDDLRCMHGDVARQSPGDTAKAVSMKSSVSVVFGHIHRVERATRTVYERNGVRFVTAASPGCLCRLDCVVPGHTRNQSWSQGVAVVQYNDDGYHSIEVVTIQEGKAVWQGKLYEGLDSLKQDIGIVSKAGIAGFTIFSMGFGKLALFGLQKPFLAAFRAFSRRAPPKSVKRSRAVSGPDETMPGYRKLASA